MIPFFRKIRKKMADDNRPLKYARYAIGEIVLVVIGILIALNINNRNIEHQKKVRIEAILESILDELATDIVKVNYVLDYERHQDSLLTIIINEDLKQSNIEVSGAAMNYEEIEISDNSFNNLTNNIDEIPKEYKEIYNGLNFLHTRLKPTSIEISERLESRMFEELEKWSNTKPWYYKLGTGNADGFIKYALNDPMFRNYASSLSLILHNKRAALESFNYQAKRSYTEIHKILNKKNDLPDFITSGFRYLSTDELQKYEGIFQYKENPQSKIRITLNEGYLRVRYEWLKNTVYDYFPKTDLEFLQRRGNGKIFFDRSNNGDIIGFTEQINGKDYIYLRSK